MRKPKPIRPTRAAGTGRGSSKQKSGQAEKLTREEKAVAKYLYNNLDSKKASMYGNHKLYFSGAKAVSCLLESKFASPTSKDHLFSSRKMIVEFCQRLISKDTFHHVLKTVKRQKLRTTAKSSKDESSASTTAKKSKEENQVTESKTSGQSAKSDKKSTKSKSADPKESGDVPKEGKSDDGKKESEINLRSCKSNKEVAEKKHGEKESKETTSTKSKDSKSEKKTYEQCKDKSPVKKKIRGKVLLDLHPVSFISKKYILEV